MSEIFNSYLLSQNHFGDFDEMAAVAAHAWDQRYRKIGKQLDYGFARQLNIPSAQLSDIGWKSGLHIETGTPDDTIGFLVQVAGRDRTRVNGRMLGADQIAVLHAPREYDLLCADGTNYLVLAVDRERVLRHAQAHWGNLPVQFGSLSALASESATQQRMLPSILRQSLEFSYDNPLLLNDPDIQNLFVDELLDAIFLAHGFPATSKSPARRQLMTKKAAEYLEENIEKVVTLRTMCEHTGTSERSLRQGFLERYGVTPKGYIKRFRLFRLRDWLRDPANRGSTITEGAMRLGLTHLGRVSAEYKGLFGELPSETRPCGRLESAPGGLADFG